MGDGRLTFEKFCKEADLLQRKSHELACKQKVGTEKCVATWEWRYGNRRVRKRSGCTETLDDSLMFDAMSKHLDGNSYLVSTGNVRQYKLDGNANSVSLDKEMDEYIDELPLVDEDSIRNDHEAQITLQNHEVNTVLLEFHIVYHSIYQTPVLYFQAVELDGTLVSTVTITRNVDFAGSNGRSTIVTLDQHPILGKPFLMLHPCETTAAMQLLQAQIQSDPSQKFSSEVEAPLYLTSWLSLVQPVTGISPFDYYFV
ncbi:hypothetical protein PsorP6_018577 [Peronosclerospora sorghi]|nr:hypothetical protein PsorP6_018577 [Peronosclerospora sorghi]